MCEGLCVVCSVGSLSVGEWEICSFVTVLAPRASGGVAVGVIVGALSTCWPPLALFGVSVFTEFVG